MAGKIFIAASSAQVFPNMHTYVVYDEDGDLGTFNDQYMINAGPSNGLAFGGDINLAVNVSVQDYSAYKIDTNNDGIIDRDPQAYFHYTELVWDGPLSSSDKWAQMNVVAIDIINGPTVAYYAWGPNSNSVTNSILSATGINFNENAPREHGVGERFDPNRYIGHTNIIDGAGSATYHIYDPKSIFIDSSGSDTVYIAPGASVIFTNDRNGNDSNTVVLQEVSRDDIEMIRNGNVLVVKNSLTGETIFIDYHHFSSLSDGKPGVETLKFEIDGIIQNQDTIDLSSLSSNDLTSVFSGASSWLESLLSKLATATGLSSPLIIDINKNNAIELLSLASSTAYFDVDGDGFAEHTGWVGSTDGLLVYDRNEDGVINNNSELFGNHREEGFSHLALLDSNADGVININDEKWSSLQVWVDANGNGYSETDELHTLDYYDIASISLTNIRVDQNVNGNIITNEGSLTYTDNSTGKIVDAWFAYDNANSVYNQNYTLDMRALFLPSVRGYGEVADLHIAMSLDNGTGGLLEMVQGVHGQNLESLLATGTLVTDIRDIMYRWAGVENIDPVSRGSNVDARELAFLEKISGDPFFQRGASANPGYQAGKMLSGAFDDVYDALFLRLVLQGSAQELFVDPVDYDIATDELTVASDINLDVVADLSVAAGLLPDAQPFWENFVRIVILYKGENNLTITEIDAIDLAISDSDPSLSFALIRDAVFPETAGGDNVLGDGGDNTLNGTTYDDTLSGGYGNDTLNGGAGGDILYGEDGDDIFHGAGGDDLLDGGSGNDTYFYNLGDGVDTIYEREISEANDKIIFGAGITISDLTFSRLNNNDLSIQVNVSGNEGEIIVENQFSQTSFHGAVETLQFSDSSTFDLTSLNFTLVGTDAGETLYGLRYIGPSVDTIYGEGGNDRIYGYAGSDHLHGGDGDDTIYAYDSVNENSNTASNWLYGDAGNDLLQGSGGVDHLAGGTGNDVLYGANGDDAYYFALGDGHDTIIELNATDDDTLHLGAGILAQDVSFIRQGAYDLKILINGGQDGSILIKNQFSVNAGTGSLESVVLDDTTVFDLTTMSFGQIGTAAGETLYGNNSGTGSPDDIIYGEGGNDTIYGYLGSDEIHGGDGNDTIHIGHTVNTYYGKTTTNQAYGDAGDDRIYGSYGVDHIHGGAGDDYLEGRRGNDHYYFNRGEGADEIDEENLVSGVNEIDTLHLGPTITAGDLSYERIGNYNLRILINGGFGGTINLKNQFDNGANGGGIEYIQLNDNTQIDLRTLDYTLVATAAAETLHGTQINSDTNDTIYGMGGNDVIHGYVGEDQLYGGEGNDTLHAYSTVNVNTDIGLNWLYGEAGDDVLNGSGGEDHLYGGIGNDTIRGNKGADHYYFNLGDGDDVIIEIDRGVNEEGDVLHFGEGITAEDITYVRDGNYNLKILVNDGANGSVLVQGQFNTGAGNGSIEYIRFHDNTLVDLRALNYTLTGTASGETLYGTQISSSANDTIYGMGGNDIIHGYYGEDYLYGGEGNDTLHAYTPTNANADVSTNYLYGESGSDILNGAGGADYLDGGDDNDNLYGNNGNDLLLGGAGDDNLQGGSGHDIYVYTAGLDTITDTAGTDMLHIAGGTTINDISFSNVSTYNTKITIDAGIDEIIVVNLRRLSATDHVDLIEFEDGFRTTLPNYASWITGTVGADTTTGTSGDNTIIGKDGNDTLDGAGGNDNIHGGEGNDLLYGGAGTDQLHGGADSDILYGQDGLDTMFGGTGADTFVFESASAFNNIDVIKDFNVLEDILDISDLLGGYDPLTDAIADFVAITESAGSSTLFVDRDGLGSVYSLAAIANLSNATGLTDVTELMTNGTLLTA